MTEAERRLRLKIDCPICGHVFDAHEIGNCPGGVGGEAMRIPGVDYDFPDKCPPDCSNLGSEEA